MAAKKKTSAATKKGKWTRRRKELAQRIAEGLAGWFQLQGALSLETLPGEDSARFVASQIVQASGRYSVRTSRRPNNWPKNDKRRMDVAILGVSEGATGWYGVIEAKWPGSNFAVMATRLAIVQDCIRLASTATANLNGRLLVIGGSDASIEKLFVKAHNKQNLEAARCFFDTLLPRTVGSTAKAKRTDFTLHFPQYLARVPYTAAPSNAVTTECLAAVTANRNSSPLGHVYVWSISKASG